eukprot:CAMPEP_0197437192 /NCGR_PEP_ID=MMETSP1175-20131217/4465_1 /TAXON_ID=1003142 /ORGANISM="Triceratium dubium, Strain CCMP147" /LENGTH=1391 /DNA_ID=CAMNT_0042966647 /DNA_START=169 /DNA_END=4344 /DNA_ORIENTATION=-
MSTASANKGATTNAAQARASTSPDDGIKRNTPLRYGEKLHNLVQQCDHLWREKDPGKQKKMARWDDDGRAFIFVENEGFKKMLKECGICQSNNFRSVIKNMNNYCFKVVEYGQSECGQSEHVVMRASHPLFTRDANEEQLGKIITLTLTRKKGGGKANKGQSGADTPSAAMTTPTAASTNDQFVTREEFNKLKKEQSERDAQMKKMWSLIMRSRTPNLASVNGQGNGPSTLNTEPISDGLHGVDSTLARSVTADRMKTDNTTTDCTVEEKGISGTTSRNDHSSREVGWPTKSDVCCVEFKLPTGDSEFALYKSKKSEKREPPELQCLDFKRAISKRRNEYSRSDEEGKDRIVNQLVGSVIYHSGRFLNISPWPYKEIENKQAREVTRKALEGSSDKNDGHESNLNSNAHGHDNGGSSPDDGSGGHSKRNADNNGPSMDGNTGSFERDPNNGHDGGSAPTNSYSSAVGHSKSISKDIILSLGDSAVKETQPTEDENSDYPPNDEALPLVAFPLATALPCRRIDHARVTESKADGEDSEIACSIVVVSRSAVPKVLCGMDTDDGSHISTHSQDRHHKERAYALVKKLSGTMFGEVWEAIGAHQLSSRSHPVTEGGSSAEWEFESEYFAVKRVPMANIDLKDHGTAEDPIREVQAMQYFRRWHESNFHKEQSGKVETPYEETVRIMVKTNVMIPVDVLTDDSYLYIIMPRCSGGDLFDALFNSSHRAHLGEEASRNFMNQALNGLEHLQKAGLAHRDISMENILWHNGSYIIADMGQCVRVPHEGQRRYLIDHSDGALVGKSHYRPPEVWADENFDGFAMDLWCLAITLFIALAGVYPWDTVLDERFRKGSSDRESFEFGSGEWRKLEETLMMRLSDGAFDLLRRCLRQDPRRRLSLQQIRDHPWMALGIETARDTKKFALESAVKSNSDNDLEAESVVSSNSVEELELFQKQVGDEELEGLKKVEMIQEKMEAVKAGLEGAKLMVRDQMDRAEKALEEGKAATDKIGFPKREPVDIKDEQESAKAPSEEKAKAIVVNKRKERHFIMKDLHSKSNPDLGAVDTSTPRKAAKTASGRKNVAVASRGLDSVASCGVFSSGTTEEKRPELKGFQKEVDSEEMEWIKQVGMLEAEVEDSKARLEVVHLVQDRTDHAEKTPEEGKAATDKIRFLKKESVSTKDERESAKTASEDEVKKYSKLGDEVMMKASHPSFTEDSDEDVNLPEFLRDTRKAEEVRRIKNVEEARRIIEAMTTQMQSEEAQHLYLSSGKLAMLAVREAGGIPLIIKSMTVHVKSERVQVAACKALYALAWDSDDGVAIREAGGIPAILEAMANHEQSEIVQSEACRALIGLAHNDDNKNVIREAGGVRQLNNAKATHAGSKVVLWKVEHLLEILQA